MSQFPYGTSFEVDTLQKEMQRMEEKADIYKKRTPKLLILAHSTLSFGIDFRFPQHETISMSAS